MESEPIRVGIIIGSTRQGRFAPVVARWTASQLARRTDMSAEVIDLADHESNGHGGLSARLAVADAFIVVTPEYNHSFPAPLKHAIDAHSAEWHAKPVAFVSYGGISGGLRAVEQLRQVFAELHSMTVRNSVSFHQAWSEFDENGTPKNAARADRAATSMLDHLAWWAHALREAREKTPYAA